MNKQISKKPAQRTIALNKKALHDYYVEQRFEAGPVFGGLGGKSICAGRGQVRGSFVFF
uniref:SsrA-binding protein n=1 Tax=Coxiella burnetii TaxID=777 RepID=UPI003905EB33